MKGNIPLLLPRPFTLSVDGIYYQVPEQVDRSHPERSILRRGGVFFSPGRLGMVGNGLVGVFPPIIARLHSLSMMLSHGCVDAVFNGRPWLTSEAADIARLQINLYRRVQPVFGWRDSSFDFL